MNDQSNKPLDLFQQIVGPVAENDQALTMFTRIEDMPNVEPWIAIKRAYSQEALYIRIIAMLMNGVISSKKTVFLLSRSFLERYMKADPNFQGRATINSAEQGKVMDQLLAVMNHRNAFLRMVRCPSKKGPNGHRAGLYTISNQEFTKLLPWWEEPNDVDYWNT